MHSLTALLLALIVHSFGVVMYEVFARMLLLAKYDRSQLEAIQAKIANGFRWVALFQE